MIVDSSAVVAMLRQEPEGSRFAAVLNEDARSLMSAGNFLETSIVIDSARNPLLSADLDMLIAQLSIEIAPVTTSQAKIARQAYRDFGKGSGHPAKLNLGDCFAYALALESGEPLLYKGDDFAHAGLSRVVA
jgi:ribonuclease VapC